MALDLSSTGQVLPLHQAERRFLEVLLFDFLLERKGAGTELTARFTNDSDAIWSRVGKTAVREAMPDFERKAKVYQTELDGFLLGSSEGTYQFSDADFPFRYASGGALPVVRLASHEYYCLFYRQVFPVGWNLANGGCDTRFELLNPVDAAERELREELLVIHPNKKARYVFDQDVGKPLDRSEFAVARAFWQTRHPEWDFLNFREMVIPLKWLGGPDRVKVLFSGDRPEVAEGCFLNINGLDFGIEVDKVAIMNLDEDVMLLDGEIADILNERKEVIGHKLVNAPVGLFNVEDFNKAVRTGRTEFVPDIFFYDGVRHRHKPDMKLELERIIAAEFLPDMAEVMTPDEKSQYGSHASRFDLCPATRSVATRYLRSMPPKPPKADPGAFEVFVCFGAGDKQLATIVAEFITKELKLTCFFSEESTDPNYVRAIHQALDSASSLVAVATDPKNLRRPFPEFEYMSFHNAMLLGRKKPPFVLISLIAGFHPRDLPGPLCHYEAIQCDLTNPESALSKLGTYLRHQ